MLFFLSRELSPCNPYLPLLVKVQICCFICSLLNAWCHVWPRLTILPKRFILLRIKHAHYIFWVNLGENTGRRFLSLWIFLKSANLYARIGMFTFGILFCKSAIIKNSNWRRNIQAIDAEIKCRKLIFWN